MRPVLARAVGALVFACHSSTAAFAEIKDYEVLRYLYLHTPCGMATVVTRDVTAERARFTADCQNKTAFPDDAAVVCTDHNDDRSCRIETKSRDFHSLELLRQREK